MCLTVDHLLDFVGRELADRIRDGDVGSTPRRLFGGGDLQNTVDINLKDTLKSSLTGSHGREGSQRELSKRCVVSAVGTLTLENRELNSCLVVNNSGESALLNCGDGLATGNHGRENVTLHSNTQGKRDDIKKQEVLSLSRGGFSGKDTGLHSRTIGNSFVGVDALSPCQQSKF